MGGTCEPLVGDPDYGEGDDIDDNGDDDEDSPVDPDPDPCRIGDCGNGNLVWDIGGWEYSGGATNSDLDCTFCDAMNRRAGWTFVEDNARCGGVSDRSCLQGTCRVRGMWRSQAGLCGFQSDGACPDIPVGGG